MKLLLQNIRRFDTGEQADILLAEGKIADIASHIPVGEGMTCLDGGGLTAAPGLVDMHVHLRDPGQTHKEDLTSASRAAAAGGVTSLLAMPNTCPTVDTPGILRNILARAQAMPVRMYQAAAITKGLRSE